MSNTIMYSLILSLAIMQYSCSGSQQKTSTTTSIREQTSTVTSAPFEADSAYRYIQDQVDFGYRTPGSDAHRRCGDWLVERFKRWGFVVEEQIFPGQDYFGKALQGRNIIARLDKEKPRRILLMAHWDTRVVADQDAHAQDKPIHGADDGGSGVGVLMELARQWSIERPNIGIDIILFDQEDGGKSGDDNSWCLGSQYFAKHPVPSGYKAEIGILLDMVGAHGARFYWETYSKMHAAPTMLALWDTATSLGWGNYFVREDGGAVVDDHIPIIKHLGIPSVDIINYDPHTSGGFGAHWHTQADNLEIIDKETLRAVGQTVATFVRDYQ